MNLDDIVTNCKRADRAAQKQLYELFAGKMFAICLRYTRSKDDANDLLHDGFIKVFRSISGFNSLGSFEGWMRRVFVSIALESIRRKETVIFTNDYEVDNNTNASYSHVIESIDFDALQALIEKLPTGYKTVLKLYSIEGYSHREIAEMLNISPETSRSQLSRAKNTLKELLDNCNN